jgi:hypothetical protein
MDTIAIIALLACPIISFSLRSLGNYLGIVDCICESSSERTSLVSLELKSSGFFILIEKPSAAPP